MALIKCPECGHQVSDRAKTCPSCGIDIAGKITHCPDCGEVVSIEQERCPNCHRSINEAHVAVVQPRRVYADEADQPVDVTPTDAPTENATPKPTPTPAAPERKKSRKALYSSLVVAFVLSLIVVFMGVYFYQNTQEQNERKAYENAMFSNEPSVLQNFLDMYPGAKKALRDSVEARLVEIKKIDTEWTDAVVSGSRSALELYVQRHPGNIHVKEAKLLIDSIDWEDAKRENTADAYQIYMHAHEDALVVKPEDRQMVIQLFTKYFNSLASQNESSLLSTVANVLTSFLHKQNATPEDVLEYMRRIHEAADIQGMDFLFNNDWQIDKQQLADGTLIYTVSFTVNQNISRTDADKEKSAVYKVSAKVAPDGKIFDFNMKKGVD